MASCGAVHLGHQLHVDGQAVAGIEGHSQCALEAWWTLNDVIRINSEEMRD